MFKPILANAMKDQPPSAFSLDLNGAINRKNLDTQTNLREIYLALDVIGADSAFLELNRFRKHPRYGIFHFMCSGTLF